MKRVPPAMFFVPWIYVPVLLLLNIGTSFAEGVSLNLALLQIPIAVSLADRYGWRGFVAALISCAPLVITYHLGPIFVGDRPAIFVVAVHAAWLTLRGRWLSEPEASGPRSIPMVLLLIVCSIQTGFQYQEFSLSWWGVPLLYYSFYVLGLRGIDVRRWLVIAGLLTLMGAALGLAGRYEWFGGGVRSYVDYGPIWLTWSLDRPAEFLTVLAFFFSGRWMGTAARTPTPSSSVLAGRGLVAAGAEGLDCVRLKKAKNWERANRDELLRCGGEIPKSPESSVRSADQPFSKVDPYLRGGRQ